MRLAANFDPYAPFAPLLLSERGNDRFSSGLYRLEFQESTGFVAEDFEVFDSTKPQKRLLKETLRDNLGYTLLRDTYQNSGTKQTSSTHTLTKQ